MIDEYTRAVLVRARELNRLTTAAAVLPDRFNPHAMLAAALAALMLLFPVVGAAQNLL